jgi:hemolysin activation/secretion protein
MPVLLKTWIKATPVVAVCLVGSAVAQTSSPDPIVQEQLRQQERERAFREQQERKPDVRLERPKDALSDKTRIPQSESPCFSINRILLNGDGSDQFQWSLAAADQEDDPATGRCLGSAGINVILKRIQNAVVARGFVTTRVLATQQDLKNGTLILTVIPGRIREIRFAGETNGRGTQWNAIPVSSGDILNLRDIEQGLENFKRVPTAEADIQIEPTGAKDAKPGDSDLVIRYQQALPFRLTLSADDGGSKATGKYQGGVTLSYDNWWTLNDLFYASLNRDLGGGDAGDRGTRGSTVHYSVPFGYWLLGLTTSRYRYHQAVAGANQTYTYSGTSQNGEIKVSRLLYRDASRKTTSSLRGFTRKSNNFIDDTEVEVQRRRTAGWELGVAHRELVGTTTLDTNLAYRRGTGAGNAMAAPEEAFGEGTSRPVIFTADALLSVPFKLGTQNLRYSGTWRAQWNRTPLVPQDRFAIGGRYTVRGFDGETVLSAERGRLIRNDLGVALGQSGQELYIGVDYGEVSGRSSQFLLGRRLAGSVLGVRGGYKGVSYDLFAGRPLKKPAGFETASTTAGFNANWSY